MFNGQPHIQHRKILLSDLTIDKSYQRDQDDVFLRFVERTVKDFNEHLLAPVMVAENQGKFYLWDGQARCEVVRRLGWSEIFAQISYGLSKQEQAELFRSQNNRRNVSSIQEHKAALAALDKDALAVETILSNLGLKLSKNKVTGTLTAVGAVYSIYRKSAKDGRSPDSLLRDTMTLASLPAWQLYPLQFSDRILKGIWKFYWEFDETKLSRTDSLNIFGKVFQTYSPNTFLELAARTAKAPGSNNHTAVAYYLAKAFNKEGNRGLRLGPLDPTK